MDLHDIQQHKNILDGDWSLYKQHFLHMNMGQDTALAGKQVLQDILNPLNKVTLVVQLL